MRLREGIISGIFSVLAAVLAALVPIMLPTDLSSTESVILVSELETQVSPDLLVEQFQGMDLKALNRRMTVLTIENVGSKDIENFKLEIRTNVDWENIVTGSNVSGPFFSGDQMVRPMGDRSFQGIYQRFPPNSQQHIFLISDEDFSILDIIPNRDNISVVWADKSLFEQVAHLKWRNYLTGALWLVAGIGLVWTVLRLLKWRITLQMRRAA